MCTYSTYIRTERHLCTLTKYLSVATLIRKTSSPVLTYSTLITHVTPYNTALIFYIIDSTVEDELFLINARTFSPSDLCLVAGLTLNQQALVIAKMQQNFKPKRTCSNLFHVHAQVTVRRLIS